MRITIIIVFVLAVLGSATFFTYSYLSKSTESKTKLPKSNIETVNKNHPKYLRVALQSELPTMDPGLAEDTTAIELVEQLFLGLTDYNPNTYEVIPELAQDWSISKDGRVYTFNLRKDAKWTDGKPVTAFEIEWAIKRNIKPETASPYAYVLYPLINAEEINRGEIKNTNKIGVKALDKYTIQFKLKEPAGYFPAMAGLWTYRPQPVSTVKQYGKKWTDPGKIVTNGSYMLKDRKRDDNIVIIKNPDYYDAEEVRIEEVRYYIIPESSTALTMYENDELDIIGGKFVPLPSPEIPRIKEDPALNQQYLVEPDFCTYYFGFNNSRPPTDNVLVRKAISAAIDRRMIIDQVVKGNQTPATTFTRPPIFGSVDPKEGIGIQFDPEQAKKWLAEAGYPEARGFPEIVLMHNTSENHSQVAQAVQASLKRYLNIPIRIENQEFKVYLETLKKPTSAHIHRLAWCADYADANNFLNEVFHPTKSVNRIHWQNAEYAKVVEKAQNSSDQDERKRLYRRAEQILTEEEAAIVPIYFFTAQHLVKPWVKNFKHMALGGYHIRDWYLD